MYQNCIMYAIPTRGPVAPSTFIFALLNIDRMGLKRSN